MRRIRHVGTKVWFNPATSGLTGRGAPKPAGTSAQPEVATRTTSTAREQAPKGRIVAVEVTQRTPEEAERIRLLAKLMSVEGRPAITKAADAYAGAGFGFPAEEAVQVKLLEHQNEATVCAAIENLRALFDEGEIKRKELIQSRLRGIEEHAEETSTRRAAEALRRHLSGLGS